MPKTKPDRVSRKILTAWLQDSRRTADDPAERVGRSLSPCLHRGETLEDTGVFMSCVALVDSAVVDLMLNVFASINLAPQWGTVR